MISDDTQEALQKLQLLHQSAAQMAEENAIQNSTDQQSIAEVLQSQHDTVAGGGKLKEFSAPHLVLSSKADLITAAQNTSVLSEESTALTSQKHLSLVSGSSIFGTAFGAIKLAAYQLGMKLIAVSGDIDIRALKDNLHLFAQLKITQTAESILLSAHKTVKIQGGGSESEWSSAGIVHKTSGKWESHASNHAWLSAQAGNMVGAPTPKPGQGQLVLDHFYQDIKGEAIDFFKQSGYEIVDILGKKHTGKLNETGHTQVNGLPVGAVNIVFDRDPRQDTEHWTGIPNKLLAGVTENVKSELLKAGESFLNQKAAGEYGTMQQLLSAKNELSAIKNKLNNFKKLDKAMVQKIVQSKLSELKNMAAKIGEKSIAEGAQSGRIMTQPPLELKA